MIDRIYPRILLAGAILLGHALVLAELRTFTSLPRATAVLQPEGSIITVQIIVQSPQWHQVPLPEVVLQSAHLENALQAIQFKDDVEDELAGIIAPASAPRLSRYQSVEPGFFARRAHLVPGHPMTVVLAVEVREDWHRRFC